MPSPRYSPENPPAELLDGVRQRLATVCADWPAELFETMTIRAAWIEFKYDRAITDSFAVAKLREVRGTHERAVTA